MDTQQPKPRQRLGRADRQQQIIKAAQEVFLESGLSGTRTREIAQRAGITEAYLYRHFSSKDELYVFAIEEPLGRLVTTLRWEIDTLKATEGIRRQQLLERANLVFLNAMVEITPLLTVTVFAELSKGKVFYRESIRPKLQEAFRSIIVDVSGWDRPRVNNEVVVQAFFGIHYGLCLDYMLTGRPMDPAEVASQITQIFSSGIKEFPSEEDGSPSRRPAKKAATGSSPATKKAVAGKTASAAKKVAAKTAPKTTPTARRAGKQSVAT